MWTPDEVLREARYSLDPARAEKAAALVRPGWRLQPAQDPQHIAVRIGGTAPLAPGEPWPTNSRGIPLTFVADIDFDAFPRLPAAWAERVEADPAGHVRIFADLVDDPWAGVLPVSISLASPDVTRVAAPELPDPWPVGGPDDERDAADRMRAFAQVDASVLPFLALRLWEGDDRWGEPENSPWMDFALRLRNESDRAWLADPHRYADVPLATEVSHILGATVPLHDDVREWGPSRFPDVADPEEWSVLLALYPELIDPHGDGAWHVVIPTTDLQAHRWDRGVLSFAF